MADTAKVLVVANRTAEAPELVKACQERAARGPCEFTLLVPATPHGVAWAADMHSGGREAQEHVQAAVDRMRAAGLTVEGKTGDPDPVAAVEDEVNFTRYDEAIVSTLPTHLSKWLRIDLPHRIARVTGLPVTHVTCAEPKVAART
ncbi:MAG: hypothetical protein IRZ21_00940 [Thermoleophilaceae bacterium]|nr:hypothetical protein [Thermoleophilaceae bacterium]